MPSPPFVVAPLLLIAILLLSAVAKLRDPHDAQSVFDKLELPGFLTRMRAPLLLPYGELAVAALLLLLPGRWYVAATSLTLLLFACYLVVVVRALRFPYAVRCGCFGRLGLGWITRQTAVRNSVLLLVALVAWLDSWRGDGVVERLRHLGGDGWWLAAVVVAVVTTAFVVREGKAPMPHRAEAPDDGEYVARPIPYGVLDGPGGPGSVWALTDAAARLLVFWDPTHETAPAIATRLPAWQAELSPVRVHLVSRSEWAPARDIWPEIADDLLGDPEDDARARLGVFDRPGAVLLGTDRLLAGGPVAGLEEIEELVAAAAGELRAAAAAALGAENAEEPAVPTPEQADSSAFSAPVDAP